MRDIFLVSALQRVRDLRRNTERLINRYRTTLDPLSQRLAQSAGGNLTLANAPGGGAECTLRLPVAPV